MMRGQREGGGGRGCRESRRGKKGRKSKMRQGSEAYPLLRFQVLPAIVGVAMGLPVEEIGPAPPMAASHTIIS